MLAPIPYTDLLGYQRRSKLLPSDLQLVESRFPGYIAHRIAGQSSRVNARLKKRYAVPLGQNPPALVASGTAPPPVTLTGRPTLGSLEMVIEVTLGGALGVATFQWSQDGGLTFTVGVLTAASVTLGTTGLTALFPALTYTADNVFLASTPVPEIAILWLVALVDVDVWQRRGVNPQDPMIQLAVSDRDTALAEIKEAADSKEGLYDLPTNDAIGDSAVTQGGPMSYSEQSPYVWTDQQREGALQDDQNKTGDSGGTDTP